MHAHASLNATEPSEYITRQSLEDTVRLPQFCAGRGGLGAVSDSFCIALDALVVIAAHHCI